MARGVFASRKHTATASLWPGPDVSGAGIHYAAQRPAGLHDSSAPWLRTQNLTVFVEDVDAHYARPRKRAQESWRSFTKPNMANGSTGRTISAATCGCSRSMSGMWPRDGELRRHREGESAASFTQDLRERRAPLQYPTGAYPWSIALCTE